MNMIESLRKYNLTLAMGPTCHSNILPEILIIFPLFGQVQTDRLQTESDAYELRAIPFEILRGGGMENFADPPSHIFIFSPTPPLTYFFS